MNFNFKTIFIMKKLLLLFCFTYSFVLLGQNKVSYAYDASGNRVKREIILSTRSMTLPDEDKNTFFTEEVAKRHIKIYPNPTYGQLAVEISDIDDIKSGIITILTINGQQVLKKEIDSTYIELDISSRQAGTYILIVEIDGEKTTWKIIKNNPI